MLNTDSQMRVIPALMALAALTLAIASAIHFGAGLVGIHDPFPGAAIPEAVLSVVMAVGAVGAAAGRRAPRWLPLAATLLTLLGTLYGLSVTLGGGRTGDVAYHLFLLTLLVVCLLLIVPGLRRAA
jgi:hypothetical protein